MTEGHKDAEIVRGLVPSMQDLVIQKHASSFFVGTMLEQMLRSKGLDTLILAGVSTEGGIEWTARHATLLGFMPVIVEDAVGSQIESLHHHALEMQRGMFPVMKTQAIIRNLR